MRITIENIWISPGHDFKGQFGKGRNNNGVVACESVTCTAGKGIVGDRYYGHSEDYKGQITFFSSEVATEMQEHFKLEELDRSTMRRNVLVSGVDLNALIGKRFRIGELIFVGSEECTPCFWMNEAVSEGALDWLKGRGGLRCRIETSGTLKTGETRVEILGDGTTE